MPVVVRQLVLPRPPRDLLRLAIRPAVAVLLATIALVQEPLIVALQLVVENDAPNPTALAAEALLCALVGAIDLGVVRQLARLPEAGVEGLAGFVAALGTFVAIGFEEVPAALGQDDGSVVRAERTAANQPLVLQMPNATARIAGLVAQVVEVALGHNPKRADGPEHAALGAVDLVDAVALSDRPTLASAREVEIPGEHVARVTVFVAVAFAAPTTTAEIAVPRSAAIAVVASRIVPVPHGQSPFGRPSAFAHPSATVGRSSSDCAQPNQGRQRDRQALSVVVGRDRSCRQRTREPTPLTKQRHESTSLIPDD